MNLTELLRSRRSVRSFRSDAPPDATLEALIEAAVTAPSASNKQPWRFFIVKSEETIAAMARAVREAVEQIAAHIPPESEAAFRAYGDYFTRFENAPVVIVPIHRGHRVLSQLVNDDLDPALRAQLAEAGPEHIRANYHADDQVEQYLQLYGKVLAAR